ncbi:MAG: hypothetical protein OXG38_00505 [Chloroflexi bacterium]|nr:hypothetical protein [Chloroflexota bacterium]
MPMHLFGPLARRPLLVVALLTAALLVALPAVVSAQQNPELPPRQFWGSNDTVTVDGQPWDGSTIDVIDEDGNVVATVERESMGWSVVIPNDVDSFRFRARNNSVSELYELGPAHVEPDFVLTIGGPERPVREVALLTGFNFVVWTGHTQDIDDALETFPDTSELSAIFEYNAEDQNWDSYRPGLPAFAQGISDLRAGVAYYLLVKSALTWEMPSDGALTGTRTIAAGFTAIGWAGPDATPQEVLDAVADSGAVRALFRFNATTQRYESYRPGLPEFAQGIRAINAFDVLFVHATSPTTITQ